MRCNSPPFGATRNRRGPGVLDKTGRLTSPKFSLPFEYSRAVGSSLTPSHNRRQSQITPPLSLFHFFSFNHTQKMNSSSSSASSSDVEDVELDEVQHHNDRKDI